MSSSIKPQIGSKKVTESPAFDRKDKQLLGRLAKYWESFKEEGLKTRLTMGAELNQRLGPPTKRLSHGQAVLKEAAKRLHLSESELSRMRWFAHRFPTLARFHAKHPGITSWTKVKELLPTLQLEKVEKGKGPKTKRGSRVFYTRLVRTLDSLAEKLRRVDNHLDDVTRAKVTKSIQDLARVARKRLRLAIDVAA